VRGVGTAHGDLWKAVAPCGLAVAWPGPTALVVGVWAVADGIAEFAFAFATGETAGTRALLLPGGLGRAA
jgi:hypothetical protein